MSCLGDCCTRLSNILYWMHFVIDNNFSALSISIATQIDPLMFTAKFIEDMRGEKFQAFFRRVISFDIFTRPVISPYGTYRCARVNLLDNPSKEILMPSPCSRVLLAIEGFYRQHGY